MRLNKIITAIFFSSLFGVAALVMATDSGVIRGVILDRENNKPLIGANIQIKKTFLGTVSDIEGRFILNYLKPEIYWLKISFVGYETEEIYVDLTKKDHSDLTVKLTPAPIQMNQMVITGSRQPEELAAAVASINVLDAREIRSRNNYRLDDALLAVPGVNLVGENINIRGGSGYNRLGGSRILVLLDDVPILTSDLSTINWNIVPISAIDHIEILKGAASSVYGSGAISGVINVITKNPNADRRLTFRQSVGVYDHPSIPQWQWTDKILYYHRTDVGYNNHYNKLGFRCDIAHHFSTGDRELGQFERWYFTGKSNWQYSDRSALTLFLSYSLDNRDLFLRWLRQNDALRVPDTDKNNHYKMSGKVGYVLWQKLFSPTFTTKLRISYNEQLVGLPFNLTTAFSPALGLSGELQLNWLPHPEHSISFGVDYKHDQVRSKYYGKQQAEGISPYIQEIWKISRIWQLNTGLRYDTYTLVGDSIETQLSPRIGVSYQPFHGTILHLSFGQGFRAASVVERFLAVDEGGDVRVIPNPQLQPERSTLFDFGIRQSYGYNFYAELTAFLSEYRNLIELTLIPQNLNVQFQTYPNARIQGVEIAGQWQCWHEHLSLSASATWMDPREITTKTVLPYRPRFLAFFTPKLQTGNFSLEADYRYAARLARILVYPRDEQVPTKVWNVRLGYEWHGINFQLLINNVANYNYTVSERVLGEIRNYALSVSGEL